MAATTKPKTHVQLPGSTVIELKGWWASITAHGALFLSGIDWNSPTVISCYKSRDHKIGKKKDSQLKLTFKEWHLLKKNKGWQSVKEQGREVEFVSKPDHLFDIAHANFATIAPYNKCHHMKPFSNQCCIIRATSQTFSIHLWYSLPELAGLALFDRQLSISKWLMISTIPLRRTYQVHTK